MAITIDESGVTFGPFPNDNIFLIEKSKFYDNGRDKLKTVEFVYVNSSATNLLFLEAKTTAPNINNPASKEDIQIYLNDLEKKFHHSLAVTFGLIQGRHEDEIDEVSSKIKNVDLKTIKIVLTLVITNFKIEWLPEWQDLLNEEFRGLKRAWKNVEIYVINKEIAKEKNLVV